MNTEAEGTQGNDDAPGTDDAGNTTPPNDSGEIIVAIGAEPSLSSDSEDDEIIDGEPAPQWAKDLRRKAREDATKIRELEATVARNTAAAAQHTEPETIVVGVKPTLESCEFDSDKLSAELEAYFDRKAKAEQQARDRETKKTAAETAYATKMRAYQAGALALKVTDFDASEKTIEAGLSLIQQSIIVKHAKNSALFVYAVGRDPAKLAELSKITDPVAFAYEVAAIEKEIKTMPKSKFQAEKRPEGGGGGGRTAGTSAALEAARKEAEKTGDYTKVTRLKAEQAKARQAAA